MHQISIVYSELSIVQRGFLWTRIRNEVRPLWLMRAFYSLLGLLIAIFWVVDAHAQNDSFPWNPKDSIRLSLNETPSYSLWFDSKISTISGETVTISGYRYGILWDKMAAYTGYYYSDYKQINGKNYDSYKFSYLSSTFEYELYRTHRFGVTGFGQVGAGYRILRFSDNRPQQTRFMMPLEFGVNGSVRFLRYFGVSAGVGSRVALFRGGQNFTGPIYFIGFTCFPSTMYRDAKRIFHRPADRIW